MALIKCSECGKEVSDKASVCPNCGCSVENMDWYAGNIIMKKCLADLNSANDENIIIAAADWLGDAVNWLSESKREEAIQSLLSLFDEDLRQLVKQHLVVVLRKFGLKDSEIFVEHRNIDRNVIRKSRDNQKNIYGYPNNQRQVPGSTSTVIVEQKKTHGVFIFLGLLLIFLVLIIIGSMLL